MENKVIAIDFDGTIVEEKFPLIGEFKSGAKETIADLYDAGYTLVLWTCRTDDSLDGSNKQGNYLYKALSFLEKENMLQYFTKINENVYNHTTCRKVYAHYYIDDRNIGGFIGWDKVRQILLP